MPLATDSVEMVMLGAPSSQSGGIRVGVQGMVCHAVTACVTHPNDVVRDAHDDAIGIAWDLYVSTGVQSGL